MTPEFRSALEGILRRTDRRPSRAQRNPAPRMAVSGTPIEERRQWFSKLAVNTIMPLLDTAAETARKHGAEALSELTKVDGKPTAMLVITRRPLPPGARPPQLIVYATEDEPPLMIEFTGTFPNIGATGGFGAEIDFEPIYPSQLEEKILDFVELACGIGSPPW